MTLILNAKLVSSLPFFWSFLSILFAKPGLENFVGSPFSVDMQSSVWTSVEYVGVLRIITNLH